MFITAIWEKLPQTQSENRKNLNVTSAFWLQKRQTSLRVGDIKYVFILRLFLIPHNIKFIQGFNVCFGETDKDRMRNRFYASFRIAANAKCTP